MIISTMMSVTVEKNRIAPPITTISTQYGKGVSGGICMQIMGGCDATAYSIRLIMCDEGCSYCSRNSRKRYHSFRKHVFKQSKIVRKTSVLNIIFSSLFNFHNFTFFILFYVFDLFLIIVIKDLSKCN